MKLFVVGLGPGGIEQMTTRAVEALRACDVIAGYTVYVDLVRDAFSDKEFLTTPMRREAERCRMAIEATLTGKTVAMICSGDSGVYGMAGLIYQLAEEYPPFEIEVISGITAACSGASVLGAPLTHDFAVISLSDLLTPLELIHKRIECAAMADFSMVFYNPSSQKRADYLRQACDIILKHRSPETVCGTVQNIGREGECGTVMTLAQLRDTQVDMFTTVFIGNSNTTVIAGKMVTPRGYDI